MTNPLTELRIVEYRDDLAWAFHDINAEWINEMFVMEPSDRKVLENPREMIIDREGIVLFVEAAGLGIVGTVALMKTADGVYELTKMGVTQRARGCKAGEFLLVECIERAKQMKISSLFLLTNHICEAAIHLYEKVGFRHDQAIMHKYGSRYDRCDVAMSFPL